MGTRGEPGGLDSACTVADARQGGSRQVSWSPALMLAFGADGLRGPEWLDLEGEAIEVGRGSGLFAGGPLEDPRMSRRHLAIRRVGDAWQVEDLGSSNGTRLGGRSIEGPVTLTDGDVLRAGDTLLVYVAHPATDRIDDDAELAGCSDSTIGLRRTLDKVAPHDTTVLLVGETGTGKEVAARYLHRRSGREGPFVAVNCAALSPSVLESELFGHRKGAFTGAVDESRGLFRAGHGGTLLLDEVGEMPPEFQAKLLRVLETGQVRPVGGSGSVATDTRVVAATNRDLLVDVRTGRFRADLYARLAQWPVSLKALRERRDDIPVLVRRALRLRGDRRPLRPDLAEALLLSPWPLNVRGLLSVVNMALIASPDNEVGLGTQVFGALEAEESIADASDEEPASEPADPGWPSDERIEAQLKSSGGRVAAAARSLGLSRQQIYRWLEANERTADDYR
jgi:transcriptional regulator with GAF, ATPase, and Fis domain